MPEGSLQVNHLETNGIEGLPYLQLPFQNHVHNVLSRTGKRSSLPTHRQQRWKLILFMINKKSSAAQFSAKGPLGLLTLSFVLQPPKKFSPILPKCHPTHQKCLPSPKSLFLHLKILPTPQKWVSIYHTGSHIRWKPFEGRIVDMCVMDTCDTYVCIYEVSHSVTNSVT